MTGSKLHPRFRPPPIPPSSEIGERLREVEHTIELIGLAMVSITPPHERGRLRAHLNELADAAWSQSQASASTALRRMAEAVPVDKDEPKPF